MYDKLTSEMHQNAAWMYRVIKYGAHLSISCGHTRASTTAATTTATLEKERKKMTKRQYKTGKIWGVCAVARLTKHMWQLIESFTFMLPCVIIDFFLNNQPDALVIQIYSVIKRYMFRASSLPIIRSFLLYSRQW
jgi:hypothetical protein